MAEVVHLAERKAIQPKTMSGIEKGQRWTCTLDPNAPAHEQWVWVVSYVRTYQFYGSAPTSEAGGAAARKRIHRLIKRQRMEEESE